MNLFLRVLVVVAFIPLAASGQPTAPSVDSALRELSAPSPRRARINEPIEPIWAREEGWDFRYRPDDMYTDCADAIDALVKSKEPVDARLLKMAHEAKALPERYRAVWVLIQRQNANVVSVLEKMILSASAEERYLAWTAYEQGVRDKRLAIPQSFATALKQCKSEPNSYVRWWQMEFLGTCKAKEAVPFLLAVIEQDDDGSVIRALGRIGDPDTVPAIIKNLKTQSPNDSKSNRPGHLYALGRIGTAEAVDCLIGCIDEGCAAVDALFLTRSPKALPAIEKYLTRLKAEKKPDQRDLATAQISVLRLKHADPREHLLALVEDREQTGWVRTRALDALEEYDRAPVAKRLLKLYQAETEDLVRRDFIYLLGNVPGNDITEAFIDQALADTKDQYYFSHYALRMALNQRLNTSFREMAPLVRHLKSLRDAKNK